MLISILLCLVLKRLRELQKKISFIFGNNKLICAHQVGFIFGTIISWISGILGWVASAKDNCTIENASDLLSIMNALGWFFVQLLILYVFVKYGKPVEDDARTLIKKKLQAVYS